MQNLRSVCANDCMLRSLPPSFGRLAKLRKLELRDNYISTFPVSLRKLKQLEELQLAGNHFALTNAAQLALELPMLRLFSAPEEATGETFDNEVVKESRRPLKHAPKRNSKLASALKAFWQSLRTEDERESNAWADQDSFRGLLRVTPSHCLPYYLKGICLEHSCPLVHDDHEISPQTEKAAINRLQRRLATWRIHEQ
jgi:Leucine-rich repeat (LRR) protein